MYGIIHTLAHFPLQYARTDTFINLREVSKRLMLPPGRFCIIPSTFARDEEGDFMLRVYVERQWGEAEGGARYGIRQTI